MSETPLFYSKQARKKIAALEERVEYLEGQVEVWQREWNKVTRQNNTLLQNLSSAHSFINRLYIRLDHIKQLTVDFCRPFEIQHDLPIDHSEAMKFREWMLNTINGVEKRRIPA